MAVLFGDPFVFQSLFSEQGVGFLGHDNEVLGVELGFFPILHVDEFLNGVDSVSDYVGGNPPTGCEELSADGLDAQVVAMHEFLNEPSCLIFFQNVLC